MQKHFSYNNKYAVVAAGGVFPDAPNLETFWKNIVDGKVSINHLPGSILCDGNHLDKDVYGQTVKNDKSYTNLGAAIDTLDFNGLEFKIPPSTSKHMEDNQKVVLLALKEALKNDVLKSIDKRKISVFIGSSGIGDKYINISKRYNTQRIEHYLRNDKTLSENLSDKELNGLIQNIFSDVTIFGSITTEDTAPGNLPGITASRINSVFDFHGRSAVVDTACASGLAAISFAINSLDSGESDAVICGAADMSLRESGFIMYSGINALSPDGSFPFDERANGFIIGQGGGIVILKRLADAVQQNDPVWAVVTAAGYTSDGQGKAIAAPNPVWQAEAVKSAYEKAGYSPSTVEYIEAHGTATKVGDVTEVSALKQSFADMDAHKANHCGLSSVKSNIGHLKSAAGMAGFVKAVLAIKNKTLPPVAGFKRVNPDLNLEGSPFYVIDKATPWAESEHPRRAGVSAFGFGGVNYHIALEEFRAKDYTHLPLKKEEVSEAVSVTTVSTTVAAPQLLKTSAESPGELIDVLNNMEDALLRGSASSELIEKYNAKSSVDHRWRLSFAFTNNEDFISKLKESQRAVETNSPLSHLELKGIFCSNNKPYKPEEIAWVFPGQGAQYAGMMENLLTLFPSLKNTFLRADNIWKPLTGVSVSELIFNTKGILEDVDSTLRQTRHTHAAVFTADYAIFSLLNEMGLEADSCIGHSAGELVALTAAGAFSFADGLKVMEARSRAFTPDSPSGKMLAIKDNEDVTQRLIDKSNITVWLANMNSPKQTVVSGSAENIEIFSEFCNKNGVTTIPVDVSEAFHSPRVKNAGKRFADYLSNVRFKPLTLQVMSNETAELYAFNPKETRERLSRHITSSVQFTKGVEQLYKKGVRLFVEVGPNAILGNNIKHILEGKDFSVITTNFKKKDDTQTLYRAFSQLFALGINLEEPPILPSTVESFRAQNEKPAERPTVIQQPRAPLHKRKVVYSGVSVGLPGTYKHAFREDNFQQLFQGRNFIEKLSDEERKSIVDLHVRKLIKSEQGASYKDLDTLNDVIQFASKMGQVDFEKDFGFNPKELSTMSSSIAHAVAAGYEALKDAHIPLVHQYTRTNTGSVLPEKWALPQYMQKRTGVIFANGFPLVDPVIEEVSRHLSHKLGNKLRKDIFEFYNSLIDKIQDTEARKILTDWYALNYNRFSLRPTEEEVYAFNHQFMDQISSQANNRLARYLNAQGPNFLILSACSSTATAVTLSEEMIQSGRVDRMIIVGADDTGNKNTLPYIGAGFLSTGAASNLNDLYDVAIPFDKRRNGMVVGSGAVGIVLEAEEECLKRGVTPVAELVGTHCFNTAGHPSALDIPLYADALDLFMDRMNEEQGLDRKNVANSLVYMSHEPSTPPKGGCSQSEAVALQHVFGEDFRNIIISNTKGMTGHTMGASIEDATAAKCLQYGKTPPVVNYKEADPLLEGLRLSKGEDHQCRFALRMAAGFGSQGNYILLKKVADGDNRIFNEGQFQHWLKEVSNQSAPVLEKAGNRWVVSDKEKGAVITTKPLIPCFNGTLQSSKAQNTSFKDVPGQAAASATVEISKENKQQATLKNDALSFKDAQRSVSKNLKEDILKIVSGVSGYPTEMLELDMEFEADLGIDTVKQATILGLLAEKFGLQTEENFKISAYPTLNHLLQLIGENGQSKEDVDRETTALNDALSFKDAQKPFSDNHKESLLRIVSDVSGYPVEMLELDMEFEADLGIDTVKQATILGLLAEKFGLQTEEDFKISAYPTSNHLLQLIGGNGQLREEAAIKTATPNDALLPGDTQQSFNDSYSEDFNNGAYLAETHDSLTDTLMDVLVEKTDYVEEMLDETRTWGELFGFDPHYNSRVKELVCNQFNASESFTINDSETLLEIASKVQAKRTQYRLTPGPYSLSKQTLILDTVADLDKTCMTETLSAIILADDKTLADMLKKEFGKAFKSIEAIVTGSTDSKQTAGRFFKTSPCDCIIDSGFISQAAADSIETKTDIIRKSLSYRFNFFKEISNYNHKPKYIVSLISLDGKFGIENKKSKKEIRAEHGLLSGFYKSLRKEWELKATVFDIGKNWKKTISNIKAKIIAEIEQDLPYVEICFNGRKRQRIAVIDSSFNDTVTSPITFTENDTVLVAGGGRGITAEFIKGLSTQCKTNFAVIGRTVLNANAIAYKNKTEDDWNAYKVSLRKELLGKGEKATPIAIEQDISKIKKSLAIYELIETVKNNGCGIKYYSADLQDFTQVQRVVNSIKDERSNITALIHGAGEEISHKLEQKSETEFFTVVGSKVFSALHLEETLKNEPLKRVLTFSSISGRFGNKAQLDYSAANDFADVWIRSLNQKGISALSINWSGWDKIGMAVRNSFVKEHAEKTGIHLIDPSDGVAAALQAFLSCDEKGGILIHKGIGPMYEHAFFKNDLSQYPFIDRFDRVSKNETRSHRVFSPKRDQFLDHHRVQGLSLMPGIAYLEAMAEHFKILTGKSLPLVFKDMNFFEGCKFHNDAPKELSIVASPLKKGAYEMRLFNLFNGRIPGINKEVDFCSAIIESNGHETEFIKPDRWVINNTKRYSHRDIVGGNGHIEIGPLLDDMGRKDRSEEETTYMLDKDTLVQYSWMPFAQFNNPEYPIHDFVTNTCFMDTLHQAGAIYSIYREKSFHLPVSAEEFGIIKMTNTFSRFKTTVKFKKKEGDLMYHDILCEDENGNACIYIKNSCYRRVR